MSKLKFDIDKKQLPQIVGLGALSLGLFGYFGWRVVTPPAMSGQASAAVRMAAKPVANAAAGKPGAAGVTPTDPTELTDGAAPVAGMRDPFIPLITDDPAVAAVVKPTLMASAMTAPGSLTPVPGLPSGSSVQPLPGFGGTTAGTSPLQPLLAAPTWTVTGVLAANDDKNDFVAVLRQGDVRRFVRMGAMVDDQYRLVGIDRSGVTLLSGKTRFRIALGSEAAKSSLHVPVTNGAASGFLNGSAPAALPAATITAPGTASNAVLPLPALPASLSPSASGALPADSAASLKEATSIPAQPVTGGATLETAAAGTTKP